jgi:hypothetical protein
LRENYFLPSLKNLMGRGCSYSPRTAADALALPRPPTLSMAEAREQLSEAMLSYLSESRRMDNRKLLREFGIALRYPDLASGLRDIKQFKVTS